MGRHRRTTQGRQGRDSHLSALLCGGGAGRRGLSLCLGLGRTVATSTATFTVSDLWGRSRLLGANLTRGPTSDSMLILSAVEKKKTQVRFGFKIECVSHSTLSRR